MTDALFASLPHHCRSLTALKMRFMREDRVMAADFALVAAAADSDGCSAAVQAAVAANRHWDAGAHPT
jgi:hypothetical protein